MQVDDRLGFRARRRITALWLLILVIALVVVFAGGLVVGPTPIPAADLAQIFAHRLWGAPLPDALATSDSIVWEIRLPRVLLGAAVGAGLAAAGVVLQVVVRNMLADPYTLGINSGASTGAALAILFGAGAIFGDIGIQSMAFLGAVGASLLMFFIARSAGRLTSVRLLMAGVAIGYALSAVTSFLVFASDSAEGARSVMFWLLGSLGMGKWNAALVVTLIVVVTVLVAIWALGTKMDALTVGDDAALTLGVSPDRLRVVLVVLTCLLVGTVVAMAGSIGFVGLVVPHAARRLVGGAHRHVLPVSAVLGAALLIAADIGARSLMAPQEIPIGILTALVGAPFLLLLVRRMGAFK